MLQSHNTYVSGRNKAVSNSVQDWRWEAVLQRDRAADGQFVYAVSSTGIFCRPTCPSRKPAARNVRFFDSSADATKAGFRACKRCQPDRPARPTAPDEFIARAAKYLADHVDEQVSLSTLARLSGMSTFHLQRRFKHVLGVSPREYQAACRAERFRRELRSGRDVAAATYEAGYGSPSRVYESTPTGRGISPATYRRGGAGVEIGFVTTGCKLGWLLVAATSKGVCAVKLGDSAAALESDLRGEFPRASVKPGRMVRPEWVQGVVDRIDGDASAARVPLDVLGTAFQWRVWRALQQIAPGDTRSYSDIARAIGAPAAVRAVARACATNPVCLVIPCHRVVAKGGALSGYRWGVARKARLLETEKKAK